MTTVCNECDNLHRIEPPDSPRYNIWYNLLCKAKIRRSIVDPVTGENAYVGQNDFGQSYTTDKPYHFCRDINDGHCKRFQSITPDVNLDESVWGDLDN